eukprot:TRINITY_DN16006_c0_g1_i4.p1 TRINITY_DN16006_c0_g1~~TRINITY_DN16006_c0_g1_i4.p1  ORF type:complete len:992 (+),score=45.30 TRINITY_DN16006_c0_g1_i4:277-2976(+)
MPLPTSNTIVSNPTPPPTPEIGAPSIVHTELPDGGDGGLTVSSVNLGKNIAGTLGDVNHFYGPSPTHSVADKTDPTIIYFSWTEDLPFGTSEVGADGKIHLTKIKVSKGSAATSVGTASFDGFIRASGIDINDEGTIGTLCAKHYPPWLRSFTNGEIPNGAGSEDMGPLMLAVCEVNSSTMEPHKMPWRIGKQWDPNGALIPSLKGEWLDGETHTKGSWGNYPLMTTEGQAGYGWLTYASFTKTWTAWYGATVGTHSGFAMHTYYDNAPNVEPVGGWGENYTYPVPGIQNRFEDANKPWVDQGRIGTGDHQEGSATRYHPVLGDIGLTKHVHGSVYMQHYGLNTSSWFDLFYPTGHKNGRNWLMYNGHPARWEGGLRPCGTGWILGLKNDQGNICARVMHDGEIRTWKVVESSAATYPGGGEPGRNQLVRIATLGSQESEAKCDGDARFLYGYTTEDKRRWLVELDSDCNKITTPFDVTEKTTWPRMQEWTTTAEGAVAWVTGWAKTKEGKPLFNEWGTRSAIPTVKNNGLSTFGTTNQLEDTMESAYREAQVTVYWPSNRRVPSFEPTPKPHCQVWLYDGFARDIDWRKTWASNANQLTKETMYLGGEGTFPLHGEGKKVSSVKVSGEGCAAVGYLSPDCSGESLQKIFWNTDGTGDARASGFWDIGLGIVSPGFWLHQYWLNDAVECVKVCRGVDCDNMQNVVMRGDTFGSTRYWWKNGTVTAEFGSCTSISNSHTYTNPGTDGWDGLSMPGTEHSEFDTLAECETKCASNPQCAYWVYWPANGACFLQDCDAVFRRPPIDGQYLFVINGCRNSQSAIVTSPVCPSAPPMFKEVASQCWVRMPSGCQQALSETSTPTQWFVDPQSSDAAKCTDRLSAFNNWCVSSDAESQWGSSPQA